MAPLRSEQNKYFLSQIKSALSRNSYDAVTADMTVTLHIIHDPSIKNRQRFRECMRHLLQVLTVDLRVDAGPLPGTF